MSEGSGNERCYVDNAMNRRLGRAGMPLGSMVVSSRGSSASSSGASYFGSSLSDGGRTYVDNYMNRGLGRVGMPLGSMVVSNRGNSSSLFDDSGICLPSSYSERSYVDNYMNRGLGRVGMPLGSMVASSRGNSSYRFDDSDICLPSSYSEGTYVDNYMNRRLGHVGMPFRSMVVSRGENRESNLFYDNDIHRRSLESERSYEDNWEKQFIDRINKMLDPKVEFVNDKSKSASKSCTTSPSPPKLDEDNKYNQGLGGVSRSEACSMTEFRKESSTFSSVSSGESSASSQNVSDFSSSSSCTSNTNTSRYDDVNRNIRLLDMPVGSKPASNSKSRPSALSKTHVDNQYNRRLGRVGMEHGSMVVSKDSGIVSSNRSFEQVDLPLRDRKKDKTVYDPLNRKSRQYGLTIETADQFETEYIKVSSPSSSVSSREGSAFVLNDTSHSKKKYFDSPLNRNSGRVDIPFGSKPVSKPKSRSSSPKTYVDNEYNRRLGRVGMKHGSMVVSKDSEIASFKETKQYTDNSKSRSSSSSKTYVDNEYNRSHGRVGLKHGSMVVSKDSGMAGSRELNQHVGLEHDSMVESKDLEFVSSTGMKHYVDNSTNRSLGRVGLPYGANAEEVRAYKDNILNRRLGRADQPIGVAVQSNSGSLEPKFYADNAQNRSLGRVGYPLGSRPYGADSEEVRVYKDNLLNRKLERAGLPIGAAVQSKSRYLELKFYTDNAKNRRLGRVFYPLGCRPEGSFTGSKRTYCDNYLNRQLGRVGKKLGTAPVTSRKKIEWFHEAYQRFRGNPDEDIDFATFPTLLREEEEEDAVEQLMHVLNRLQLEREWQENEEQTSPVPKTSDYLLHYSGPVIEFSEINLGRIIGSGGFGKVYYGTYKDSVVAVKLYVKRVNKRLQKEFFNEVNILSKLDNPFIVKFIGACTNPPNLSIVMEYMQMSLHEALHVGCTDMDDFTDDDRLMMIIQTLTGLEYLHDKRMAHCDIKSRNILIDHDGEKFTVAKLSDFGLIMMKNETDTPLSSDTGLVCHLGTPIYSSPERLRREYLNLKQMKMSDMYSYGLVVFEILCGVQPFRNLSLRQLQTQVGEKNMFPQFPDDIHPNIHLAAKLLGCWDREPKNRPTTTDFLKVMNRISCVYETLD